LAQHLHLCVGAVPMTTYLPGLTAGRAAIEKVAGAPGLGTVA
jgi:hypothetical protein